MNVIDTASTGLRQALLTLCLLSGFSTAAAADALSVNALAGIEGVQVAVVGIHPDFARYGLDADEMRRRVEARLADYGLTVEASAADTTDRKIGRLEVRLITNKDQFAFYHYAVSVKLERRIPLDEQNHAYGVQSAWSEGRHGILNPSDLGTIYGYVDELLGQFITAHDKDNAARRAAMNL
ncbi:MAG: hypothetical protein WD928_00225 [Gammaproteobacteria bacterium]